MKINTNIVPIFATKSISLDSEDYPRGLISYNSNYKKIPIFSRKYKKSIIAKANSYDINMLEETKKRLKLKFNQNKISDKEYKAILKVIKILSEKEVLEKDKYMQQIFVLNRKFGKYILNNDVEYIYIALENIATKLLIDSLKNKKGIMYKIILDELLRKKIIKECNNIQGCWSIEQKRGTLFFFGIDRNNKRYLLKIIKEENIDYLYGVDTLGQEQRIRFDIKNIIKNLEEEKIIPSIFTELVQIHFECEYNIAGGCFQSEYVESIRSAIDKCLKGGEILKNKSYYMSGPVFDVKKGIPNGLIEIIEKDGYKERELEKLFERNFIEANQLGLFEFYSEVIKNKDKVENWEQILENNILKLEKGLNV